MNAQLAKPIPRDLVYSEIFLDQMKKLVALSPPLANFREFSAAS